MADGANNQYYGVFGSSINPDGILANKNYIITESARGTDGDNITGFPQTVPNTTLTGFNDMLPIALAQAMF